MQINRCINCMKNISENPCPYCGFDNTGYQQLNYALPVNSILDGRYLIGRMLGQGGFGLTYVGWDLTLEQKVAIKEYYPSGQVTRHPNMGTTLLWNTGVQAESLYTNGMESFLREARKMTKLDNVPAAVHVLNTFAANDTAYIVMEYIEGETLEKLLSRTGPMRWENAKDIFYPVLEGMVQVHAAGLIHRDLSPDNIMLQPDGQVRILDLGAAKDLTINSGASSVLVAKVGFSPIEQYTQRGNSGTWTDVYSMAATIYYALTGVLPQAATDRINQDQIDWNLPQLSGVPVGVREALQRGMAVSAKERTQSMEILLKELQKGERKKKSGIVAAAGIVLAAAAAGAAIWYYMPEKQETAPAPSTVVAQNTEQTEAVRDETEAVILESVVQETLDETEPPVTKPVDNRPVYEFVPPENMAMIAPGNYESQTPWGWNKYKRKAVKKIVFHDNMDSVPEYEWNYHDYSKAQDKSILGWMEDEHILHLASNGRISFGSSADYLFAGFTALEEIEWNNCVDTSEFTSSNWMFANSWGLETLDLSEFDLSNVTSTVGMFAYNKKIRRIEFGKNSLASSTDMSKMFTESTSFQNLDLTALNTSNVTTMQEMFKGCKELRSLDLSSFDVQKVKTMEQMFMDCSKLSSLDLSSFVTTNVETMKQMFENCSNLNNLNVSNFDTFKTTSMARMFIGCTRLSEPNLDSFDFVNVSDYWEFMDYNATIHGRSWRDLFWQERS